MLLTVLFIKSAEALDDVGAAVRRREYSVGNELSIEVFNTGQKSWRSDRAAKETYKAANDDLYRERQEFKGIMTDQIADVRQSHAKERQEWRRL